MGIISKQSISNTLFSYAGIGIGVIYSVFLVPLIFNENPQDWGLVQLILSYVQLLLPFALLGVPNIIIKYWPVLNDHEKKDFIPFIFILGTIGMVILSVIFFSFIDVFARNADENNNLLREYLPFTALLLVFQTYFYIALNYCRALLRTSFPTALKDSFTKFFTLILILLYGAKWINFHQFFLLYVMGFLIQLFLIIVYSIFISSIKPHLDLNFFRDTRIREILRYGGFSLLSGGTVLLAQRIDIIMIGKMISLEYVAYYATAYFFMTAIMVPMRSVISIAGPLISSNINQNNMEALKKVYLPSSLNMLIFSGFVFLGVWVCVNELMLVLGDKFGQIKWVLLFLGTGKILESIFGLNQHVIIYSKYFKWDSLFQIILLALTIVTNLILIPGYGINGAAFATLIAIVINQLLKSILVYARFRIQPLNSKSLFVMFIIVITILFSEHIPILISPILSLVIKAALFTLVYFIIIYIFRLSTDLNNLVNKYLKR